MSKYVNIFILVLCVFLVEAKAQEIFSWEECIKEASENHPDLISAKEKLNQAKANKAITQSSILPQISSSLSGKTSKTDGGDRTETYSYGLTGKQLLFDGSKTSHNIRAALENIKAAQYNYEIISSNVRLKLKTAFIELLKAQELLDITEDIAKRRKQNLELVQLRYKAGREHRGSLLTAQANWAQARFEVAQARRNIELAQRRLTKELGRGKLAPIRVKGDFVILSSNREKPDFEDLAQGTPLLKELIVKEKVALLGLKSAQADFLPQVSANASASRSGSDWPPQKDSWSAGASLSLPIFEGGSRFAAVSKTRSALNQAQADERSGRDNVILTLEDTWKKFQDAMDKVGVQQKFLEAARERAKITQAQYSTGLISFDNWIIIEDALVSAKKSFLDVQATALVAEANWIQAKGGTLDYVEE